MGLIVVKPARMETAKLQEAKLGGPFDWESFQWGLAAGGIIVTAVGGVVLYFTWPYILATFQTFPIFKELVAEAKTLIK